MKITELASLIRKGGYDYTRRMHEILTIFFSYVFEVPVARTGVDVIFDRNAVYNTVEAPGTGNVTSDMADAREGVTVRIFHTQPTTAPTFPADWKLLDGEYTLDGNNLIEARYLESGFVGYTIRTWA